ncbi:DUF5666 domain-containing protein [Inquilinus limosus]|uniref:Uncharacterized protein n=1 Tax=Inquilinus limosus TaxID=171674 RepID=A0A211ZML3_9PROT|nr:DUF5666 domain-containing protein [Inquilinus limosus]OWJ66501.1 hypothetical protein BWR60_14265 [Inquilinus limosus]
MKRSAIAGLALFGILSALPAMAQSQPQQRIRGTIEAMDGPVMTIAARGGTTATVTMADDAQVRTIAPADIHDIKPGTYIGSAAMPQADGSLQALEVQVFPESMRGVGEGQHPFDLKPGSTMTNATAGDVTGTDGRVVTMRYQGVETKLVVPPDVPVITYEPGNRSQLVKGAHVIVSAVKADDGSLVSHAVQVGKDGLVPPM